MNASVEICIVKQLPQTFCTNEGPTLLVCSTHKFLKYVSFLFQGLNFVMMVWDI